jgi:dTDP-4-amino-4,6-dideoxygalactose transaminase
MREVPFLRPNLVKLDKYRAYIESAEQAHVYSNFGPLNTAFEQRVIQEIYCGSGAGTTVSNATIGLMLAIRLLGRKGRFAVMPSYTFAAAPLAA